MSKDRETYLKIYKYIASFNPFRDKTSRWTALCVNITKKTEKHIFKTLKDYLELGQYNTT